MHALCIPEIYWFTALCTVWFFGNDKWNETKNWNVCMYACMETSILCCWCFWRDSVPSCLPLPLPSHNSVQMISRKNLKPHRPICQQDISQSHGWGCCSCLCRCCSYSAMLHKRSLNLFNYSRNFIRRHFTTRLSSDYLKIKKNYHNPTCNCRSVLRKYDGIIHMFIYFL